MHDRLIRAAVLRMLSGMGCQVEIKVIHLEVHSALFLHNPFPPKMNTTCLHVVQQQSETKTEETLSWHKSASCCAFFVFFNK